VLVVERVEGHIPFLMLEKEHCDIRSVNPSTGEIKADKDERT